MKGILLAGIALALFVVAASAEGPIPDPWAPSNYVVVPAPGNGAIELGYDSRRWNYWQTNSDAEGNLYGYDAQGNYWTYRRRTNVYHYHRTEPRWQARCYTSVADLC